MHKKLLVSVCIVVGVIVGLYFVIANAPARVPAEPVPVEDAKAQVFTFQCSDGNVVQALFQDDMALVALPNEEPELLTIAVSASGARYANADESLVFWNKGRTAMVERDGVMIYADCVTDQEF